MRQFRFTTAGAQPTMQIHCRRKSDTRLEKKGHRSQRQQQQQSHDQRLQQQERERIDPALTLFES